MLFLECPMFTVFKIAKYLRHETLNTWTQKPKRISTNPNSFQLSFLILVSKNLWLRQNSSLWGKKMNVKRGEIMTLLISSHVFILGSYYFILPSSVKFSHKSPRLSPKQSGPDGRTPFLSLWLIRLKLHLHYQSFGFKFPLLCPLRM